jgi:outer membrane protein TolC
MPKLWFQLALVAAVCGCQASTRYRPWRPSDPSVVIPPDTAQAVVGGAPMATAPAAAPQPAGVASPATQSPSANIRLTGAQGPADAATEAIPAPEAAMHAMPIAAPCAMSLPDALATGLAQNPDLVTLRGTANVSAAAVDTAGVYPWNPFVQAQYFPQGHPFSSASSPGGQAGGSNYYVWLMQRFELGHQRRYREESASAALGQVKWNIRQAELLNLAQSERLFFGALYQRQLRDLASDTETLATRLVEIVEHRFQAGLATNLELVNARVAARQSRRQNHLAEAAYQAARLALVQQLGLSPETPLDLTGDLTRFEWLPIGDAFCSVAHSTAPDPRMLAAEMAEARPDVMAARFGASIATANASLARAARIQDIQAGPIYETADDGTRYLGLRLQREFGVFNNGTALRDQRDTEVQQQLLAHQQLKRRATNEAAAAIDRYERARRYAAEAASEDAQSPRGELAQVVAQFEAGKADIINVLAIQNNLLMDLRAYLDLLNEVAQSAALVTQTTGLPPERLMAPARPEPLPPVKPEAGEM